MDRLLRFTTRLIPLCDVVLVRDTQGATVADAEPALGSPRKAWFITHDETTAVVTRCWLALSPSWAVAGTDSVYRVRLCGKGEAACYRVSGGALDGAVMQWDKDCLAMRLERKGETLACSHARRDALEDWHRIELAEGQDAAFRDILTLMLIHQRRHWSH